MKPADTCLVLGAGASVPYGYPTGKELASEIIKRGKERDHAWAPKDKRPEVLRRAADLAERFQASLQQHPTIDSFLDQLQGNQPARKNMSCTRQGGC